MLNGNGKSWGFGCDSWPEALWEALIRFLMFIVVFRVALFLGTVAILDWFSIFGG